MSPSSTEAAAHGFVAGGGFGGGFEGGWRADCPLRHRTRTAQRTPERTAAHRATAQSRRRPVRATCSECTRSSPFVHRAARARGLGRPATTDRSRRVSATPRGSRRPRQFRRGQRLAERQRPPRPSRPGARCSSTSTVWPPPSLLHGRVPNDVGRDQREERGVDDARPCRRRHAGQVHAAQPEQRERARTPRCRWPSSGR